MKNKNHRAINHHYIQAKFLALFSKDNGKRLYFINKNNPSHIHGPKSPVRLAFIEYFYDYPDHEKPSLEGSFFQKIDSDGILAIRKLEKQKTTYNLSNTEQEHLISYVSAQLLRIPAKKRILQNYINLLKEIYREKVEISDDHVKSAFLNQIKTNHEIYREFLKKKKFTLFTPKKGEKFIIGDNPVMRMSVGPVEIDVKAETPAVNDDMIAMPISPYLLLIFFDDKKNLNLKYLASQVNTKQIHQATEHVYAGEGELLEQALEIYYKEAYDIANTIRPDLVAANGPKRGAPIVLGPLEVTLSEELKKQLYDAVDMPFNLDMTLKQLFEEMENSEHSYFVDIRSSTPVKKTN